jgi:hypothetical protein
MARLTPQQRARKAAIAAQDRLINKLAEQEKQARTQPIKARAASYDVASGEWAATTPDGGTVSARSLSNANIKGKSLPLQRFQGSAQSAINEAPTEANFGPIYQELENVAQILLSRMGIQIGTGDPNTETVAGILDFPPRYNADVFYDTDSGTFWRWFSDSESDPAEPEWVPMFQLLQGFSGVPAATVYIDGALAVNDSGTAYTGTISGGWSELSGGGGGSIQVSQATFGSATITRSDNLIYQAVSIPFDQLNCFTATQQDIVLPSNGIYELTTRCIITNNRNDPPTSPPLFPELRARGYLQSDDSQVLFYEMVREFQQVFDTSSAPSHILTNEFVFEVTEPVYFQLDGDDIVSPLFGPTITATIKKMS